MLIDRKRHLHLPAVLAVVLTGFLIYSNTLGAPFVLDDLVNIVYNGQITDPSAVLSSGETRQVAALSFAMDYAVWGLNPAGFHLTNLLIHIANSLLVYLFLTLLFKTPSLRVGGGWGRGALVWRLDLAGAAALVTALFFLVHPLQTQAVSYVTQRYASLATLFYLGAVVLYLFSRLRGMERGRTTSPPLLIASLVVAIVAMKTKETAFTLPFAIAAVELFFFSGEGGKGRGRMMRFIPLAFYLPTLVIIPASLLAPELGLIEAAGGGGGVSEMMRRMKLEEAATLSSYGYLLTQFTVIATYLGLFLFPAGQRFDYDYPLYTTLFEPAVLVSLLMLLSLSAVAVFVGLRRGRWHSPGLLLVPFGVLWFFLTLSVESSVVPIRDVIFEHRCYLPSIGLFTATSVLLVGAARRRRSVTVLIVLMLVSLSVTTHLRNRVWADDLALYTDEVLKTPGEASPHNYLAMAYGSRGMLKEAAVEYRKALKIDPGFHAARNNLALALMSMGDLGGAAREFSVLAKERSTYAGAHYNLGLIYMEEGMKAKAREALERAKSLDPRNPDIERVLNALDPA